MYEIRKDGGVIALTEAPDYIRRHPDGFWLLCGEDEAEGVAVGGMGVAVGGTAVGGTVVGGTAVGAACAHQLQLVIGADEPDAVFAGLGREALGGDRLRRTRPGRHAGAGRQQQGRSQGRNDRREERGRTEALHGRPFMPEKNSPGTGPSAARRAP